MAPKLYMVPQSPACKTVLLTAEVLGIKFDQQLVNLQEREQYTPEFSKLNPLHTIPVLDDDGFIVCDSHVIAAYLVEKYGKNDALYPKDPQKRAIVAQRLHYDNSILFNSLIKNFRPLMLGAKELNTNQVEEVLKEYGVLNAFVGKNKFIAGDNITIADFSLLTTINLLDLILPVNSFKFRNLAGWLQRMRALHYYSIVEKDMNFFRELVKDVTVV